MEGQPTWLVVLGSAGLSALISTTLNLWLNWWTKRREFEIQELSIAHKLTEMKHQQLLAAQEWAFKQNGPKPVEFRDPLQSVIEYREGLNEYRRTGKWSKAEASHRPHQSIRPITRGV